MTALLHHVNVDLLRDSYFALKREAAPGVDDVTWEDHGTEVEARLEDLHGRVHRGAYRAKPSKRVLIPKPDGRKFWVPAGPMPGRDRLRQWSAPGVCIE